MDYNGVFVEAILKNGAYAFIAAGKARSRRIVDESALSAPNYLAFGHHVYKYDAELIKRAIINAKASLYDCMSVDQKRACVIRWLCSLLEFVGVLPH